MIPVRAVTVRKHGSVEGSACFTTCLPQSRTDARTLAHEIWHMLAGYWDDDVSEEEAALAFERAFQFYLTQQGRPRNVMLTKDATSGRVRGARATMTAFKMLDRLRRAPNHALAKTWARSAATEMGNAGMMSVLVAIAAGIIMTAKIIRGQATEEEVSDFRSKRALIARILAANPATAQLAAELERV